MLALIRYLFLNVNRLPEEASAHTELAATSIRWSSSSHERELLLTLVSPSQLITLINQRQRVTNNVRLN